MSVTLTAGAATWEAGSTGELHALFSTIGHRLEPAGWGSRFPTLMNELYQDHLRAEAVPAARAEFARARDELTALPPAAVVWDIEDLSKRPPDGETVGPGIDTLADFFFTNDGEPLVDVLDQALGYAEIHRAPLEIRATDPASIPDLGLRVGPNVWAIGDRARVDAALAALAARANGDADFGDLTGDGLDGADLDRARAAVGALRETLPEPVPELRTQDGRDLLAILDEALAYASRTGRPARIEPIF